MFYVFRTVVIGVALGLTATSGWAEEIFIPNFGFDEPNEDLQTPWRMAWDELTPRGSGWNAVVDAGWFPAPANAALGGQAAIINCCGNTTWTNYGIEVNYQSNMLYTLQFDVGAPDRAPDSFRRVTEWSVHLWRGGAFHDDFWGEWNTGFSVFEANHETFGTVETTAGAGGVWKHVTAQWNSGDLPQEVLDSVIQIRIGTALTYAIFDNFQLSVEPAPEGVEGDYNNDGVVDAADYVTWRRGGPLANEVADPGTVSPADYDAWRARFGNTSGSGSGTGSLTRVPEPSAITLLAVGIAALSFIGSRRRVTSVAP